MADQDGILREVCDQRYADICRRVGNMETMLQNNLEKLYGRIDEVGNKINAETLVMARRPGWGTTILVSFFSSSTVALLVLALTGE
jgi:hypothetical protein